MNIDIFRNTLLAMQPAICFVETELNSDIINRMNIGKNMNQVDVEFTQSLNYIEYLDEINYEHSVFIIYDQRTTQDRSLNIVHIKTKRSFRCDVSCLAKPLNDIMAANVLFNEYFEEVGTGVYAS